MTELRKGLPHLPLRMRKLPVSSKGYPVPFFAGKHPETGEHDFRLSDPEKFYACIRDNRCWICGEVLGKFRTFAVGPITVITRSSGEPPSHWDCAHFAMQACPFLALPKAQRRTTGLEGKPQAMGGTMLLHNPGVMALWVTHSYRIAQDTNGGILLRMGEPERVQYYAEGKPATRQQVLAALEIGLPKLRESVRNTAEDALVDEAVLAASRFIPEL